MQQHPRRMFLPVLKDRGKILARASRTIILFTLLFTLVGVAQTPASSGQNILSYLKQNIDWQRQIVSEQRLAADTSDTLFFEDDRQTAIQILKLAFEYARAHTQILESAASHKAQPVPGQQQAKYISLAREAAAADAQVHDTEVELQSTKAKLEKANGSARRKLQSTIDELQSEIDLDKTRSKTLHDILQFVGAAGTRESGGLSTEIDQLQRSVPDLESGSGKVPPQAASSAPSAEAANQSSQIGILALVESLFAMSNKTQSLDQRIKSTDALLLASQELRAPLVATVTTAAGQGEQIMKQADSSDPAQLENLRSQLDGLTANFKAVSTAVLPLEKQAVLLDSYRGNLTRWREALKAESAATMRKLSLRLLVFGLVTAFIFALAEIWRRAVFRYVHDVRRRYQFLLLRRVVLWCAIGITAAFALASEIGSIATFAGLMTAGLAVALQNVLLAIAGYFFLIGKYGVRVGDRVQISGVTGDVFDIGLIRLHLMEVGGTGTDRQPTGRIVVFSNAVVFQPTASFFKQIPGSNFVSHEVSLTLFPDTDYGLAEKRILSVVEHVYAGYRDHIEAQHRSMLRNLNVPIELPKPRSQLRLTQSGLEIVVRYPVELTNASEIDDQIARELLHALEQPPRLRLVGTGSPNIQPVHEESKTA